MNYMAILYAVLALGGLGVLFGVVLSIADSKFSVPTDGRTVGVRSALPGANCGACGYPGCDAFAQAVVDGKAKANGCTPGGATSAAAIAKIMGVEAEIGIPMVAQVLCQGEKGVSKDRYEYTGYQSCQMAATLAGGAKFCSAACLGLGDCVKVCPFDAITVVNGLARIDRDKCTACEKCVAVCPNHTIKMLPRDAKVIVRCQNQDPPKVAMQNCDRACIACKRCVKACNDDAIAVEDNIARIFQDKCTRCGACAEVCPTKCITIGDWK